MNTVVIIGASHAAAEAIPALRKQGYAGRIVLIGDEAELPYQRPPLSKGYLKGDVTAERLTIKKQAVYDKAEAELRLGRTAVAIDREQQQVVLDDGEHIPYSHLIICTGTRARPLPIEGADLNTIFYLRTQADVNAIKNTLGKDKHLLIVGAGYIGLEVAASAKSLGMQVTVVETMDRVLARVTSPIISDFYTQLHQSHGVDIKLGAALARFEVDGTATQAVLNSGEVIRFDAAVVGIGVIPNTEIAEQAGLLCDNGIAVDEFTQTSDSNIYAVGDCSNHPNTFYNKRLRLESVPNAVDQAKTAVKAICGTPESYDSLPWFWSDQYDIKLQTAGLFQDYDDIAIRGDINSAKFTVFYLKDQKLIASDSINSPAEFMMSRNLIPKRLDIQKTDLENPDFDLRQLLS